MTAQGKAIATVRPPHGVRFDSVQGASDDRTFVVEGDSVEPAPRHRGDTWYLLRIAPGTARPYELTKLPVKLPIVADLCYALSPDGRELAVESQSGTRRRNAVHHAGAVLGIVRCGAAYLDHAHEHRSGSGGDDPLLAF